MFLCFLRIFEYDFERKKKMLPSAISNQAFENALGMS